MAAREKMICPNCGATMNLHAEKVDYTRPPDASEEVDEGLGGPIEEFHTCPSCGLTQARHAG